MKKKLLTSVLAVITVAGQLFTSSNVAMAKEEYPAFEFENAVGSVDLDLSNGREFVHPFLPILDNVNYNDGKIDIVNEASVIHFDFGNLIESERLLECTICACFIVKDDNGDLQWESLPGHFSLGELVWDYEETKNNNVVCGEFLNKKWDFSYGELKWERIGADIYYIDYEYINNKYTVEQYEQYMEDVNNGKIEYDQFNDYTIRGAYFFIPDTENDPLEESVFDFVTEEESTQDTSTAKPEETTKENNTTKPTENTTGKENDTEQNTTNKVEDTEKDTTAKQEETTTVKSDENEGTTTVNETQSSENGNADDGKDSPDTGDNTYAVVYVLMGVAALGSVFITRKMKCVR